MRNRFCYEGADIPASELLTAQEAAQAKGVHRNSLYRAISAGRIEAVRRGGRVFLRRSALEQWSAIPGAPRGETVDHLSEWMKHLGEWQRLQEDANKEVAHLLLHIDERLKALEAMVNTLQTTATALCNAIIERPEEDG